MSPRRPPARRLSSIEENEAAKKEAAKLKYQWEGAGIQVGVQIWRVENKPARDGNAPRFGMKPWPEHLYGQFYRGDSYIVLNTRKNNDKNDANRFFWDIYFWIGSGSSQDEYGVVAYKANELDDLLGAAPVQHREVEGQESDDFMACFPKGVRYLEGGIDSGFRHIEENAEPWKVPNRLFLIHRNKKHTTQHQQQQHQQQKQRRIRVYQVRKHTSSLNQGDAFLLDCGTTIYTWFGSECSPFEKERAAQIAHNMSINRSGHSKIVTDVQDDDEVFWNEKMEGSREEIRSANNLSHDCDDDDDDDDAAHEKEECASSHKMWKLSSDTKSGQLIIEEVEPTKSSLTSEHVFMFDDGRHDVYVWIGKASSREEQSAAMLVVEQYLRDWGRGKTTSVTRVKEGQELRCHGVRDLMKSCLHLNY